MLSTGLCRRGRTCPGHPRLGRASMRVIIFLQSFRAVLVAIALASPPMPAALGAESVTLGGLTFTNKGLVGVGRLPAGLRDKFGETFGSGSGLAADLKLWTRTSAGYSGVIYMLPDRG